MSTLEDAVARTSASGRPSLILCPSKKGQESVRVMLYAVKKKSEVGETVGISKVTGKDGKLYVKVFLKPLIELFTEDEFGEIVPAEDTALDHPEIKRLIFLMKKDGKSTEEIQEATENFKKNFSKVWEAEKEDVKEDVVGEESRKSEKEMMMELMTDEKE